MNSPTSTGKSRLKSSNTADQRGFDEKLSRNFLTWARQSSWPILKQQAWRNNNNNPRVPTAWQSEAAGAINSDEYGLFSINVNNVNSDCRKQPTFYVNIAGTPMTIMVDSGSSINILNEQDYNQLSTRPRLQKARIKIYPYQTETLLPVLGRFTAPITSDTSNHTETFYVVKGTGGSLLSWRTSNDLELLKVVKPIKHQRVLTVDQLTIKYQDLFQGLGKLKNYQVHLHIDESVPPVAQPHRHVPFNVRKQLEEQLSKNETLGLVERVEGPTPWVSPIVVAPKPKSPGRIRVCVDAYTQPTQPSSVNGTLHRQSKK